MLIIKWVIFPLARGLRVHVRSDSETRLETIQTNILHPSTSGPNRCFCAAFKTDKNKRGGEMCHRSTSALSAGPHYRGETASFIGLPGVLLVCFGERGSSRPHRFTVTSCALWSASPDRTLSPQPPRAPIY